MRSRFGNGASGRRADNEEGHAGGGVLAVGATGKMLGSYASAPVQGLRKKGLQSFAKWRQDRERKKQNAELENKVKSIVQAQIAAKEDGAKPDDSQPKTEADKRLEKWVGGLVKEMRKGNAEGASPAGGKAIAEKTANGNQASGNQASGIPAGGNQVGGKASEAANAQGVLASIDSLTGEVTYSDKSQADKYTENTTIGEKNDVLKPEDGLQTMPETPPALQSQKPEEIAQTTKKS